MVLAGKLHVLVPCGNADKFIAVVFAEPIRNDKHTRFLRTDCEGLFLVVFQVAQLAAEYAVDGKIPGNGIFQVNLHFHSAADDAFSAFDC